MTTASDAMPPGLWYVKRGDQVRGPFRWEVIAKNIGLGRIRQGDRISQDRERWLPPPLAPEGADGQAEDYTAQGSAVHDERRGERRGGVDGSDAPREQREGLERRAPESTEVLQRRARSERVWAGLRNSSAVARGPLLVVGALLGFVLVLSLLLSGREKVGVPDCAAAPSPAVNWDFCVKPAVQLDSTKLAGLSARNAKLMGARFVGASLREADFAYADMTAADFTLADLGAARLVGANLRNAQLNHARLAHSDLRFADLTGASLAGAELSGARLANAIWIDGRVCARNSIGACIVK